MPMPTASAERKIQELEDQIERLKKEIEHSRDSYRQLQVLGNAREQVLAGMIDKLIAELGARPYGD